MSTICLNMIVKNESKIIRRMLESVITLIDTYCICDTGSTDNTVSVIKDFFNSKNMEGKIIYENFINFEYNRNYALNACKNMADYILFMDADMVMINNNFDKNTLLKWDVFCIFQGYENFLYPNIRIIKNNIESKYIGVTHEYLDIGNNNKIYFIDKNILFILHYGDGNCKNNKYDRDINLLNNELIKDPNNCRYLFYLANSYYDIKDYENAIKIYLKRIIANGYYQEIWFSYYRIGLCYSKLSDYNNAIKYWLEGYNYYPLRIENLYEIIDYYRENEKYKIAKIYYDIAVDILHNLNININIKNDFIFFQNDIYTYKLFYQYSIMAYYFGVRNIDDYIIKILNNANDNNIIRNTLYNMNFYKNIIPINKIINISDNFKIKLEILENIFYSSSASIVKKNDNYIINKRYVNYKIDNQGKYIINGTIFTINKYILLDSEFNIIEEKLFNFNNNDVYIRESIKYGGIEDLRLSNNLNFIGTVILKNSHNIVYGKYDILKNNLDFELLNAEFKLNNVEKNWVFFDYNEEEHIIYKWYPLTICKINKNKIFIKETKKMPTIFNHVRGSSNGYLFEKEYFFIVHIVSHEKNRHYYNMFVKFDINMNLISYSAPFKFEYSPIEFCLGLIIDDNNFIVTYSVMDNCTKIAIYSKEIIGKFIKYI